MINQEHIIRENYKEDVVKGQYLNLDNCLKTKYLDPYWIALICFHKMMLTLQAKDNRRAKMVFQKSYEMAKTVMEKKKNKNQEDYALIANIHALSIKRENFMSISKSEVMARENIKLAWIENTLNYRVLLADCYLDFHDSGSNSNKLIRVKGRLNRAIDIIENDRYQSNLTWGKDLILQLMSMICLRLNQPSLAEEYILLAINKYDYPIKLKECT